MRAGLRRVAIAVIVTTVVVTEIGQGLAQPDPASVVRIELSEYAFNPPRVTLNLSGSACDSTGLFCRSISSDPTIQTNIAAEQAKLNKSASPYKFYPVLSFGVGYRF